MMTDDNHDTTRRGFLRGAVGVAAVPIFGLLGTQQAFAADKPKLDPSQGQAKALHYVNDAGKASDMAAYQDGSFCHNCMHWQGGDDEWGGCAIFPNNVVHRDGWCTAWAKAG